MREIKFRGIRVDTETWAYGNLVITKFEHGTKHEIVLQHKRCHHGDCVVEVYPESVGQFIGIVDRGGNDIYEGDIVAITNVSEQVDWLVTWLLGIVLYPLSQERDITPIPAHGILKVIGDLKIVGNVHADLILSYRNTYMDGY